MIISVGQGELLDHSHFSYLQATRALSVSVILPSKILNVRLSLLASTIRKRHAFSLSFVMLYWLDLNNTATFQ